MQNLNTTRLPSNRVSLGENATYQIGKTTAIIERKFTLDGGEGLDVILEKLIKSEIKN